MSDSAPEQEENVDPLTLFSKEMRTPVEGLIYLGQLTDTFSFCGHSFSIKTLLPQDRFAISLAMQPYRDTIMEPEVYQACHVGMALTEIDHNQDFCPPIGPDIEDFARARLNYVSSKLYPPVHKFIWNRYVILEATAIKGLEELDSLSRGGLPSNLPPWVDSLIAQGRSSEETPGDTPPSTPSS